MSKKRFELAEINNLSNYKELDYKMSNLLLQKIEQMEKYEIERESLKRNSNIINQRIKNLKTEIYKLKETYKTNRHKKKWEG